jgi:hypothetical protein
MDDNRDDVHYFDYTVDFSDYNATVYDYDFEVAFLPTINRYYLIGNLYVPVP